MPRHFWKFPRMKALQYLKVTCASDYHLHNEKCFLMFRGNLPHFSLCPLPLVLLLGTSGKSSTFFPLSLEVLIYIGKILSEYFFPGLNRERVLQSLHHLCGLGLFIMSTSLLYWRAQNWTQYSSTAGLTSSAQRGRISSQSAETFLFMNLRILLAFFAARIWFMFNHMSTRILRSFSAKIFPVCWPPTHIGAWVFSSTVISPCLTPCISC